MFFFSVIGAIQMRYDDDESRSVDGIQQVLVNVKLNSW